MYFCSSIVIFLKSDSATALKIDRINIGIIINISMIQILNKIKYDLARFFQNLLSKSKEALKKIKYLLYLVILR